MKIWLELIWEQRQNEQLQQQTAGGNRLDIDINQKCMWSLSLYNRPRVVVVVFEEIYILKNLPMWLTINMGSDKEERGKCWVFGDIIDKTSSGLTTTYTTSRQHPDTGTYFWQKW